jgi:hypothetical protein
MAKWLGSRESRALATSRLAVRVLDARTLLRLAALGRVHPLRRLGARAGVRPIARRHPATRRFSLENRTLLTVRDTRPRARRRVYAARVRTTHTGALIIPKALVRPALALPVRAVPSVCTPFPVRHHSLQSHCGENPCDPNQIRRRRPGVGVTSLSPGRHP